MVEIRRINTVDVFRPQVKITFHTAKGALTVGTKTISGVEDDIITCQTFKDLSQPAGMFIIHLVDHQRYDKMVEPMDVVSIIMSNHISYNPNVNNYTRHEGLTHATMVGLIDSVKRKRTIDQNGKPQVYCEIRGRDFGKLFIKHQIRYIPWLIGNEGTERVSSAVKKLLTWLCSGLITGGDIAYLMRNNLLRLLMNAVNMEFNVNGLTLQLNKIISYRFSKDMGHIPFNIPLQSQEGHLWDILKNYSNPPWNELWIDTITAPNRVIPGDVYENGKLKTKGICREDYSSPINTGDAETTGILMDKASRSRQQEWEKLLNGWKTAPAGQAPVKEKLLKERMNEFGVTNLNQDLKQFPVRIHEAPRIDNSCIMVFCRQTPFDDRRWDLLRTYRRYEIKNDDIKEQDLGKQDHEVFNFYWVYPLLAIPNEIPLKGLGINPVLLSRDNDVKTELSHTADKNKNELIQPDPVIRQGVPRIRQVPSAVEKYGFNPLEVQTRVWRWSLKQQNTDVKRVANRLLLALVNWHKWNAHLVSGSLTIKGTPDLHVGDMLYNKDEDMEYYVEAVTNTYTQYFPMETTALVTRGHTPGQFKFGNVLQDLENIKLDQTIQKGENLYSEPK